MKDLLLLFICLVSCQVSSGTPATECKGTDPGKGEKIVYDHDHPGPYSITTTLVNTIEVNGTEPIGVILKAKAGSTFNGFIVLAIEAETQKLLGTFNITAHTEDNDLSGIRHLDCGDGSSSSVTVDNNKAKTEVTLQWSTSPYFGGFVLFIGTFIGNDTIHWAGIQSRAIQSIQTKANRRNGASGNINPLHYQGYQTLLFVMVTFLFSNQHMF